MESSVTSDQLEFNGMFGILWPFWKDSGRVLESLLKGCWIFMDPLRILIDSLTWMGGGGRWGLGTLSELQGGSEGEKKESEGSIDVDVYLEASETWSTR